VISQNVLRWVGLAGEAGIGGGFGGGVGADCLVPKGPRMEAMNSWRLVSFSCAASRSHCSRKEEVVEGGRNGGSAGFDSFESGGGLL
jgi:hypothetical protein